MKNEGLTLVELLVIVIVIAIILLFFRYPNEPYIISDEDLAISNLYTVKNSQKAFTHCEGGYASTFKELRDDKIAAGQPAYLDIDFSGIVQGYRYTLEPAGDSRTGYNGLTVYMDFECIAEPVEYKEGTTRSFYVDSGWQGCDQGFRTSMND